MKVYLTFLLVAAACATPCTTTAQSAPSATVSQPEIHLDGCPADPKQFAALAARRGYTFAASSTKGSGTCSIDEVSVILVVSATAIADAVCDFQLFTPPEQKRHGIIRIGIKAGPGTNTRYVQRGDRSKGLSFSLESQRGETRQFRIVAVDVEPSGNKCSEAVIEGAMQ